MEKPYFSMHMICPHCKTTDRVTVESIEIKETADNLDDLMDLSLIVHYYCNDCGSRGSRRDGEYTREIKVGDLQYQFEKYIFKLMVGKTDVNLKTSLVLSKVAESIRKQASVVESSISAVETIIRYETGTGE